VTGFYHSLSPQVRRGLGWPLSSPPPPSGVIISTKTQLQNSARPSGVLFPGRWRPVDNVTGLRQIADPQIECCNLRRAPFYQFNVTSELPSTSPISITYPLLAYLENQPTFQGLGTKCCASKYLITSTLTFFCFLLQASTIDREATGGNNVRLFVRSAYNTSLFASLAPCKTFGRMF
jgi:hypothetical protein